MGGGYREAISGEVGWFVVERLAGLLWRGWLVCCGEVGRFVVERLDGL